MQLIAHHELLDVIAVVVGVLGDEVAIVAAKIALDAILEDYGIVFVLHLDVVVDGINEENCVEVQQTVLVARLNYYDIGIGSIHFVQDLWSESLADGGNKHGLASIGDMEEGAGLIETDVVVFAWEKQVALAIGQRQAVFAVVDDDDGHAGIDDHSTIGVGHLVEDGGNQDAAIEIEDAFLAVFAE